MSKIAFDNQTDRRIEFNRLMKNAHAEKTGASSFSESDFRHYLFMLGLLQFEYSILPELTGKPHKPYYSLQGEKLVGSDREIIKDYSEVTA